MQIADFADGVFGHIAKMCYDARSACLRRNRIAAIFARLQARAR